MIFRPLSFIAALALIASPVLAQQKPLVSMSGQTRQLPPATTLGLQPSTTVTASLNIPQGIVPIAPNDGDCWTTAVGLFCRTGGTVVGPVPGTANDTTFTASLNGVISSPSYMSGSYRAYHVFNLGGLDYAAEYATEQAGLAATDALTAGLKITSGSIHQTNAIAGYIESSRPRPVTNGGDVAGYFHGKASGDNANVFGLNSLASDTAGFTGQTLQNEIDINVNAASTSVQGLGLVLNSAQTISAPPLGYVCRIAATTQWGACYYTTDGATPIAFRVGAAGTGNNLASQSIQFISRSSGGTTNTASILSDANGSLLLRPGITSGAIGFQNIDGSNYGFINGGGLATSAIATENAVSSGVTALTMTNSSNASVTTKAVSQVFNGYDTVGIKKTAVQISAIPSDVNWVGAYLSISARKSDVVTEVVRINGSGITSFAGVKYAVVVVSALPVCDASAEGYVYGVSDASSAVFNSTVTGGGSNHVVAYCNGTNWTVH